MAITATKYEARVTMSIQCTSAMMQVQGIVQGRCRWSNLYLTWRANGVQ